MSKDVNKTDKCPTPRACGLTDIDETDRSAEVGIFIGDQAKRGQGFGTEALALLCDYAFNVLGLRNLMLRVAAFNDAGQKSYRKIGFKEFGRRHGSRFYAGGVHDMVYMELLSEDFGPSRLPGLPEGDS